jgi:hypothetical protein
MFSFYGPSLQGIKSLRATIPRSLNRSSYQTLPPAAAPGRLILDSATDAYRELSPDPDYCCTKQFRHRHSLRWRLCRWDM